MSIFFGCKPYVAIVGDIRRSRQLQNRGDVQRRLRQVLDAVNRSYRADIASNFLITLGDEFQGLLHSGASAAAIADRIEREMYPVRVRFGIGVGAMATDIDHAASIGADGPAYYLARETIESLKASEREKEAPKSNAAIKLQGHEELSALLTTVFSLLSAVKEGWTARQVEIINAHMETGGTQTDTAKRLKINQSNVQRALASANYYAYRGALDTLAAVLSDIREEGHV